MSEFVSNRIADVVVPVQVSEVDDDLSRLRDIRCLKLKVFILAVVDDCKAFWDFPAEHIVCDIEDFLESVLLIWRRD